MRNFKFYLLLLLLLIPIECNALTGQIDVTCTPTKVASGASAACRITGTADDEITGYVGKVTLSDGITVTNFALSGNIWTSDFSPPSSITGTANLNFMVNPDINSPSGTFDIATFTANIGNDATGNETITFSSGIFYGDPVSNKATLADKTVTLEVSGNNGGDSPTVVKGLSSLEVTGGTLGRAFDADNISNTSYTIELSSASTETFGLTVTKKNSSDSVVCKNGHTGDILNCSSITFTTDGGNPDMLVYIIVGSNETEVTYTLAVSKPLSEDKTNNTLASLTVGGKAATKTGNNSYTITLDDVSNYSVVATLSDSVNYKFDDATVGFLSPNTFSRESEIPITIIPKDASAGLNSNTYILTVKSTNSSNNGSSGSNTPSNPQTGSGSAMVMAVVLMISFITSVYLYKRNLNLYN